MIAGITVLPPRSMRLAPAGAVTSPLRPMAAIAPRSTRMAPFSMGALPSPGMIRAPSKSVVCADAGAATDSVAATSKAADAINVRTMDFLAMGRPRLIFSGTSLTQAAMATSDRWRRTEGNFSAPASDSIGLVSSEEALPQYRTREIAMADDTIARRKFLLGAGVAGTAVAAGLAETTTAPAQTP